MSDKFSQGSSRACTKVTCKVLSPQKYFSFAVYGKIAKTILLPMQDP